MQIYTTGLDDYMPGGESNLTMMVVGGPGAGKTRMSSFWPSPFYLDCENGRASIADRKVPYVVIKSSADMLKALKYLAHHPDAQKYGTIVLDTLDSYQRKIKDEWLQDNPHADKFSGYDAWGYLDAKMQLLMTRLLNLPFNVIVLVHYKEKTVSERVGKDTIERSEFGLQLQGDLKDTAFNEFDLVGWLEAEFVTSQDPADDGKKVVQRTLTFQPTPLRPFLKDRLNITPEVMQVTFSDDDYRQLFSAFHDRLDDLPASEQVGQVEEVEERLSEPVNVPTPKELVESSGAVSEQPPVPPQTSLKAMKKAELLDVAGQMGVDVDVKATKATIIEALEAVEKPSDEQVQDSDVVEPNVRSVDEVLAETLPQLDDPCKVCFKVEADPDVSYLSTAKFGKRMCPGCYQTAKKASRAA